MLTDAVRSWLDHCGTAGLALWISGTGFCALYAFLVLVAY